MKYHNFTTIIICTFCTLIFLVPTYTFAQFIPIVPVPGLNPNNIDFETYLEFVYTIAISIAALLAVGKLILGGLKYITSGVVTEKQGAKKDIQSAVIGLLIILAAVAILRTINPGLANLPILADAPYYEYEGPPQQSTTVTVGTSNAIEVQNQLNNCTNIIRYNDNTRCCNDDNACTPTPPTSNITLVGLDPDQNTYRGDEISRIVRQTRAALQAEDPSYEIVDFGPNRAGLTDAQIQSDCTQAAETRNKTLEEVVVLNQLAGPQGQQTIIDRPLCIIR